MDIKQALKRLTQGKHLSQADTQSLMAEMLAGKWSPAQITAFFMTMKMKGETFEELLGATLAVKSYVGSRAVSSNVVNVSHTGSDILGVLELSLSSAFAATAAGCRLVIHDGSLSKSKVVSGAFLEAAGIKTDLTWKQIQLSIEQQGVSFTFGFNGQGLPDDFNAIEEIGVPTLVNILNIFATPFQTNRHLIGVHDANLCSIVAQLCLSLGYEHVMVVHGIDGLDAISLATETHIAELKDGQISEYSITPDDFAVQSKSLIGLSQDTVEESLLLIKDALGNRRGHYAEKAADIIILNAGAVIYLGGLAESLHQGVSMAREAVANTSAGEKIRQIAIYTQQFKK